MWTVGKRGGRCCGGNPGVSLTEGEQWGRSSPVYVYTCTCPGITCPGVYVRAHPRRVKTLRWAWRSSGGGGLWGTRRNREGGKTWGPGGHPDKGPGGTVGPFREGDLERGTR